MKNLIFVLTLLCSISSFSADSKTLICLMGDSANMDITITSYGDKKESVTVSLTGMNEDAPARVYKNSSFAQSAVSTALVDGKFEAVLSKSDLQSIFGGAYLAAGILKMTKTEKASRYDVLFAAEDIVYTANCGE